MIYIEVGWSALLLPPTGWTPNHDQFTLEIAFYYGSLSTFIYKWKVGNCLVLSGAHSLTEPENCNVIFYRCIYASNNKVAALERGFLNNFIWLENELRAAVWRVIFRELLHFVDLLVVSSRKIVYYCLLYANFGHQYNFQILRWTSILYLYMLLVEKFQF